jgi:hypothetical protein
MCSTDQNKQKLHTNMNTRVLEFSRYDHFKYQNMIRSALKLYKAKNSSSCSGRFSCVLHEFEGDNSDPFLGPLVMASEM